LGFPPSFVPRRPRADDARRGGDRPSSTDLKLLAQHHIGLILQSCSSLTACDLASQRQRCASRRRRRSRAAPITTAALLCLGCGSRRCAYSPRDPRRPTSAPGSRSRGRAATLGHAQLAAGQDDNQRGRRTAPCRPRRSGGRGERNVPHARLPRPRDRFHSAAGCRGAIASTPDSHRVRWHRSDRIATRAITPSRFGRRSHSGPVARTSRYRKGDEPQLHIIRRRDPRSARAR
jgi:hypothetical protein